MARCKWRSLVIAVSAGVVGASCSGGAGSEDKAGGRKPVVLRLANGYGFLDSEPAVAYFVERVGELSSGGIHVEVFDDSVKDFAPGFEQQIVKDVEAGKADLAWVGTRVFDTLGTNSFHALTAPMLIDSYPLQQAVIESDIPARMLESLGALGVTGLAILADGLRKPVGVERPMLGPSDWQGITFAAIRSLGQAEAINALGAKATDLWSHPLERAFDKGEVQGREMSVRTYYLGGLYRYAPYVTANVNLWPQTAVILANPGHLSSLTEQQRGWLHQAARDAAARSTSLVEGDAAVLPAACEAGSRFANANEADLAALGQAFMPVYAHLEQDAETRAFIQEITELKQSSPAGPPLVIPAECTGAAPQEPALMTPDAEPDAVIPDGEYREIVSEEFLLGAGISPVDARTNSGIFTITIDGAEATFADSNTEDVEGPPCVTDISYYAERVVFYGVPIAERNRTSSSSAGCGRSRTARSGSSLSNQMTSSAGPYGAACRGRRLHEPTSSSRGEDETPGSAHWTCGRGGLRNARRGLHRQRRR